MHIQILTVTILYMKKLIPYFKDRPHFLILILILLLGIFFRTYAVIDRFHFDHDGDLYSWMVKDILVNHHFRLIGQETSAPGIYIGPLYYYLIAPFFLLTNMDPIGVIIPITIIGILTIFSYYVVFSKLFNRLTGLIGSFLYAILLSIIQFDRRIAPSTPSNIWVIWYFYTIVSISRGNFSVLPLLGVLIGLIWHIHIALAPTLIAIPFAFLVSRKIPNLKQILFFCIGLFTTSLPLIIFELKHNFQQIHGLLADFSIPRIGASGFYKFQIVLEMISKNINTLFFYPQSLGLTFSFLLVIIILLSTIYLYKKKQISFRDFMPLYIWVLGIIIFYSKSSSPISEYYFYNIEVIFLAIVSILLSLFLKSSKLSKKIILGILFFILLKNIFYFVTQDYYHKGYNERKAIVGYIVEDARIKNFPCFSINYITSIGENVGFRYFFYLKGAHLTTPGNGSPVYSIVLPDEYALGEVEKKFGHIGVITPKKVASRQVIEYACSGGNNNLSDPMFGYSE